MILTQADLSAALITIRTIQTSKFAVEMNGLGTPVWSLLNRTNRHQQGFQKMSIALSLPSIVQVMCYIIPLVKKLVQIALQYVDPVYLKHVAVGGTPWLDQDARKPATDESSL